MSISYHLSNRQRKELTVRAAELIIALPLPAEEADDLLAWARRVLANVDARDIAKAEEGEIVVRPVIEGTVPGLAGKLGAIVPEREATRSDVWQYAMTVVLVTLRPAGKKPRHRHSHPQWPGGSVAVSGRVVFPPVRRKRSGDST
ncbi:MAG: hypothetical protein GXP27_12815 [Planctomycetes bacterium]|nr:hypothetical protein [Planctomycetota bacterium]